MNAIRFNRIFPRISGSPLVHMNVFAKFDEIPSKLLQDIKETKRFGHTFVRSDGWTDGQRENSIPSHTHSLRGGYKQVLV